MRRSPPVAELFCGHPERVFGLAIIALFWGLALGAIAASKLVDRAWKV